MYSIYEPIQRVCVMTRDQNFPDLNPDCAARSFQKEKYEFQMEQFSTTAVAWRASEIDFVTIK